MTAHSRADEDEWPLVSIIIRSIGRPTLIDALACLAEQSYRRLEAIVVDATGGRHPPLPALRRQLDVRLVSTGQPLKRSAAANVGLAQARGEFLGFLDDDDYLAPHHVERLIARARQSDAPDLVHAGAWLLDGFHRVVGERNDPVNGLMLYYDGPFTVMSALFHRRHWERGCRLDETLDVFEDWDFWLQVLPQARPAMVDELTQLYFQEAGTSGTSIGRNTDIAGTKAFHDRLTARWRVLRDADWGVYMQRLRQGTALQSAGRLADARRHYLQLLAEYRDEPNAMFVLAQVFAQQGLLYSARRMLARAVARNPQATEYRQLMAQIEERLGNPAGAIDSLINAVVFRPALKADAEASIARLRATMRASAPAFAAAARAAQLPRGASFAAFGTPAFAAPPPADLQQRLQKALHACHAGELAAARDAYEAILRVAQRPPDALQGLARLAFDYGDLAQAQRCLAELPGAQRALIEVRRLSSAIERVRWTRAENARLFAQIRRLPFLLGPGGGGQDAAIALQEHPLVHLLLPAADRERRLALPWAALIERLLRGHADVRCWICEGQAGVWGTAERESAGWQRIDAERGLRPQRGTLVFCGVPECPPAWLPDSAATRLLVLPLAAGAGDLLELIVTGHHQTGAPVGIVLVERDGLRDGAAFDALDGDGDVLTRDGDAPAPAIVLYPPAEIVSADAGMQRGATATAAAGADLPFTIGCIAGPELQPFHPDDAALWRRLVDGGVRVRILGGASLARNFPPSQAPSGLELLPAGALEPAAFLAGLDCLLVRDGPHRQRGLGSPIVRAMAQGLPVLAARGSADSSLIDDGENGWLFDGNAQALAIVERLARDRAEAARIGAAAQACLRLRFGDDHLRRLRALFAGT